MTSVKLTKCDLCNSPLHVFVTDDDMCMDNISYDFGMVCCTVCPTYYALCEKCTDPNILRSSDVIPFEEVNMDANPLVLCQFLGHEDCEKKKIQIT